MLEARLQDGGYQLRCSSNHAAQIIQVLCPQLPCTSQIHVLLLGSCSQIYIYISICTHIYILKYNNKIYIQTYASMTSRLSTWYWIAGLRWFSWRILFLLLSVFPIVLCLRFRPLVLSVSILTCLLVSSLFGPC